MNIEIKKISDIKPALALASSFSTDITLHVEYLDEQGENKSYDLTSTNKGLLQYQMMQWINEGTYNAIEVIV